MAVFQRGMCCRGLIIMLPGDASQETTSSAFTITISKIQSELWVHRLCSISISSDYPTLIGLYGPPSLI